MPTTWTNGDISGSQTLIDNDHLYPSHINELRTAVNNVESTAEPTYVVYKSGSTYYGVTEDAGLSNINNSDLSTLVQSLFTAMTAGGVVSLHLTGNHNWTTSVTPASNITIRGMGAKAVSFLVSAPYRAFSNTANSPAISNFALSDCSFDLQGTVSMGGGIADIYNVTGFRMERVEGKISVYTGPSNMFTLYKSSHIYLSNNFIHDSGGTGLFLQGCNYYDIVNNRFNAVGDNIIDVGTYTGVTGQGQGSIVGNIGYGNSGPINAGAQSSLTIANNVQYSPRTSGITIFKDDTTTGNDGVGIVITGNTIYNPCSVGDGAGISVAGSASASQSKIIQVTITGNQIINSGASPAPAYQDGIGIQNGERVFVFGNTIISTSGTFKRDGIRIDKDSGTTQTSNGIAQYNYVIGVAGTAINNNSGGVGWITTTNFTT